MANKGIKIIAFTPFSSRVFESVAEVLETYSITYGKLHSVPRQETFPLSDNIRFPTLPGKVAG